MERETFTLRLNTLLAIDTFNDYAPNGLQVEGRPHIQRVVCGVTACQALLDAAITHQADAIVVHHGYFWKGEESRLTGIRKKRIQTLLVHNLNLFAYHLPLDAHPDLGNNAQLANIMGWTGTPTFGDQNLGWIGTQATPRTLAELSHTLGSRLGRETLTIGRLEQPCQRIAWCSGGAQSYFEAAIAAGADVFVTGEISEPMVHLARESGVPYIAAGHHATERGGIQALSAYLRQTWNIDSEFIDIENPI